MHKSRAESRYSGSSSYAALLSGLRSRASTQTSTGELLLLENGEEKETDKKTEKKNTNPSLSRDKQRARQGSPQTKH